MAGGRPLTFSQLKIFSDCLEICGLSDIRGMGGVWTWNNKNISGGRITGRLDRTLGDQAWLDIIPESYYEYLPQDSNDHSPMVMYLSCNSDKGLIPFKIYNFCLKCAGF